MIDHVGPNPRPKLAQTSPNRFPALSKQPIPTVEVAKGTSRAKRCRGRKGEMRSEFKSLGCIIKMLCIVRGAKGPAGENVLKCRDGSSQDSVEQTKVDRDRRRDAEK